MERADVPGMEGALSGIACLKATMMRSAIRHPRADASPILIVPYMWIGDFVRCHTVVRLLNARFPDRPVDVLTTAVAAPLLDYMPGVRKGIVFDLPRKRIAIAQHRVLAARLREEHYGDALIMPRTWKSALAPALAGIARRTGYVGEMRFGLINDLRFGEKALPRMVDRCAALALPPPPFPPPRAGEGGEGVSAQWPLPQLMVPRDAVMRWRARMSLAANGRPAAVLAPGAVGPSKRWGGYAELARNLVQQGFAVWIVGGPDEKTLAVEITEAVDGAAADIRDLTGRDLRNAILALAAATVAVSNDSGLLHVAAALGTPSIGIFGPTSPWHWAPLNPLAGIVEAATQLPCRPCHKPTCRLGHHRCMGDIPAATVTEAVQAAFGSAQHPAM